MKIGIDGMVLAGRTEGVQRYIAGLINAMDANTSNIEVTVFVPRGYRNEKLTQGTVKAERSLIGCRFNTMRIIWEQFWLPFKVLSYGFDLLHFPAYVHPPVRGIPTVLTVPDIFPVSFPGLCRFRKGRKFQKRFIERSVKRATRVITPTKRVKSDICSEYECNEDKIDVIPMGTHFNTPENTGTELLREFGIEDKPYIFTVASREPRKHIVFILKGVFAALMHSQQDYNLVIAGHNADTAPGARKLLAELGEDFNGKVVYTGYVNDNVLSALYSNCFLFVFASLAEGFGLTPLEAMAHGAPVLISGDKALKETYSGYAEVFKYGDLKDFRVKLEKLFEDSSLRNRLQERGKELAQDLTWERCMEKTVLTYRKAMSTE